MAKLAQEQAVKRHPDVCVPADGATVEREGVIRHGGLCVWPRARACRDVIWIKGGGGANGALHVVRVGESCNWRGSVRPCARDKTLGERGFWDVIEFLGVLFVSHFAFIRILYMYARAASMVYMYSTFVKDWGKYFKASMVVFQGGKGMRGGAGLST